MKLSKKILKENLFIILICLSGFLLRMRGIGFGLPFLYNPDEHYFINPSIDMLIGGDLNPHWFGAPGSFIMYLLLLIFSIYFLFGFLSGALYNLNHLQQLFTNNPTLFYLSGRILMVIFAVITIYLIYLIAKKHFNRTIAILASFCLAMAPLHIEHSRYIRPDITATMLIMFSIYFLLEFFDKNKNMKLLILSSLFAGFSIATKYTSGLIIFPIGIYCLIRDSKEHNLFSKKYLFNSLKIKTFLSRAALFVFMGFLITAPFVILDYKNAYWGIIYQLRGTHLGHERLPGIQNHLWYLTNALQEGTGGLFFEIFAGIGLIFLLTYKRSYKNYLFLFFPILFFLIIGSMLLRWDRWFMPLLPFEAILFGIGFYYSYKYIAKNRKFNIFRSKKILRYAVFSVFAAALVFASFPTIIDDIRAGTKLQQTDTRTTAKEWIENNLPGGSKIAYEHYAPHLHVNPAGNFSLMNLKRSKIVSQPLSYYKNQSVDYIIITDSFKSRYYNEPEKYPVEISRYEELKNNAKLIKIFNNTENPGPIIEIYHLK